MSRGATARKHALSAPAFAALGDPTRLRIVGRLCEGGPASIARLTEGEAVSRQAITKHLAALEDAGLVQSTREGRERVWELRPRRLAEIRACLEQISGQWDAALGRLAAHLEKDESRATKV
jgi:DNA-binding transcriptional ArsR family regulator